MRIALGPISRISLGLVSLAAFLILTLDLMFSLLPDQSDVARQIRKKSSEALAIQLTALVQADDLEVLRKTLHAVMSRDDQVLSISVRRADGRMMAETGSKKFVGHCISITRTTDFADDTDFRQDLQDKQDRKSPSSAGRTGRKIGYGLFVDSSNL